MLFDRAFCHAPSMSFGTISGERVILVGVEFSAFHLILSYQKILRILQTWPWLLKVTRERYKLHYSVTLSFGFLSMMHRDESLLVAFRADLGIWSPFASLLFKYVGLLFKPIYTAGSLIQIAGFVSNVAYEHVILSHIFSCFPC